MLRIERSVRGNVVYLTLSGSIEVSHLSELQRLIDDESQEQALVIDLHQVNLVDGDSLNFLAQCEARGITLENASAYVREWIARQRVGGKPGPAGAPKRR